MKNKHTKEKVNLPLHPKILFLKISDMTMLEEKISDRKKTVK